MGPNYTARGSRCPCPISFSEEMKSRQLVETWAELYAEFDCNTIIHT